MRARVEALREWLGEHEPAAFLVTAPVNVRYLTGLVSSSAALLVGLDSAHLFTDARYGEAAKSVPGVEAVVLERNLFGELAGVLHEYTAGPVGFESQRVTVAGHESLAKSSVSLEPFAGVLEAIRAVKDAEELAVVRRAALAISTALERVPELEPVGRTERETVWLLERLAREELGAEALSFPAIVASGPNSARPHHVPGDRVLSTGEILLIDAGVVIDGYCSDCTRVYAAGELPQELLAAYQACCDLQADTLAHVRAGATGEALDQAYRERLTQAGYSIDHSLGHGVGMEIHEEPRLARTSSQPLQRGQVVTVEPGIYLPGLGGVRIEDMVVVDEGEAEVITPASKELRSV